MITEKNIHQMFCKSDSLSEKWSHNYVNTQLFCAKKKKIIESSVLLLAQKAPLQWWRTSVTIQSRLQCAFALCSLSQMHGMEELGLLTGGEIATGKIGWWEQRESYDPLPTLPKAWCLCWSHEWSMTEPPQLSKFTSMDLLHSTCKRKSILFHSKCSDKTESTVH